MSVGPPRAYVGLALRRAVIAECVEGGLDFDLDIATANECRAVTRAIADHAGSDNETGRMLARALRPSVRYHHERHRSCGVTVVDPARC